MRPPVHGLYFHPEKHRVDGRSKLGKALKGLRRALLQGFPTPAPILAQLLAQRLSFKLIRAASFEAHVLSEGAHDPDLAGEQDYLRLTGSIRADLSTLFSMARQGNVEKEAPDLAQYLEAIRKQAIPVNQE